MWMGKKTVIIVAWIVVIALLLSVFVGITSVFAADVQTTVGVTKEVVKSLSLEEAQAYAKTHNYDLLSAAIDKEDINISKRLMDDLQTKLEDSYAYTKNSGDTFDAYKIRNGYGVLGTKNGALMLEKATAYREKATETAVASAYYALSEKTMLLVLKKSSMELINKQVKVSENKLLLGKVSDIEHKTVLIKKIAVEIELTSAQADYDKALMSFNKTLALPLDEKVNLTSKVAFSKYVMPDYTKKLVERKNEDITYAQLLLDKVLVAKEAGLNQAYYGANSNESKIAAHKIKKNELSLKKQEAEVEYKLRNDISGISVLEKTLAAAEASMAIAKTVSEITNLKGTLGMATELEVIDAKLKLEDAQIKYIQALHGYNTVTLMFKNNI